MVQISKKCISETLDWFIKNDEVFIAPNIQYLFNFFKVWLKVLQNQKKIDHPN